jgi:molybdate transport system substrate-binding protein
VTTLWVATNDVIKRIGASETVDRAIIAGPAIEALIEPGKLVAGSRVDLTKSGIGVAVRSDGAPHVDISSGEGVRAALLGAKSIAYSSGPSGVYIAALQQKWGAPISCNRASPPWRTATGERGRGEGRRRDLFSSK